MIASRIKFAALLVATTTTLLAAPGFASAQNQDISPVKERALNEVKDRIREQTEEKVQERKDLLEEKRAQRVRLLSNLLIRRIDAAIARIENLIERMYARLAIMSQSGADTQQAQSLLDTEKENLELVKNQYASFKELAETIPSSENPREAYNEAKLKMSEIKRGLISIHTQLAHIIRLMIGLRVGQSDTEVTLPTPTETL